MSFADWPLVSLANGIRQADLGHVILELRHAGKAAHALDLVSIGVI